MNGNIDENQFEPRLTRHLDKFYNLTVHYKDKEFTIETLLQKFSEIANTCDMIILDHIDYFDLMTDSENTEVTSVLKVLRTITLEYNIPVIILSHIRKGQYKQTTLPHKDDFMGTSNKTKITKTSILISPDFDNCDYVSGKFGTFIQIPKDRAFGKTNLVARCMFDRNKNRYNDTYELHRITSGEPNETPLSESELPSWAVHAKKIKGKLF